MKQERIELSLTEKQALAVLAMIDSFQEDHLNMGAGGYKDVYRASAVLRKKINDGLQRSWRRQKMDLRIKKVLRWCRGEGA